MESFLVPQPQTINIFAYGSNMHLGDLNRWFREHGYTAPTIHNLIPGVLENHRLVWNYRSKARSAGAANIWPQNNDEVHGVILEVDRTTFAGVDAKEGHPERYSRGEAPEPIRSADGSYLDAWVYRVTTALLRPEPIWPTREYLELILQAARDHSLPAWYQEKLRATPTAD